MNRILLLGLLTWLMGACTSAPPQRFEQSAADRIAGENAEKLYRAFDRHHEEARRGPYILDGYRKLREGMSEQEVDEAFHRVPYSQSQPLCGQTSSGPVSCKVRRYAGVMDGDKFSVEVLFRKNAGGQWVVFAWE